MHFKGTYESLGKERVIVLYLLERSAGTSLHGDPDGGLGRLVHKLALLGDQDESLVALSSFDAESLCVHQTVVPLGVDILEVASLGGEGLVHVPLLQDEGRVVSDDGLSHFLLL